jgi:alkylhydroperoxidase family enzyme
MPRVKEIEQPEGDPILEEIYARDRAAFGDVLNTTKVYAHCPPILRAAKALGKALEDSGRLDPLLRALVCVRVAQVNGCPF